LYDNLGKDETLALAVDHAIHENRQDDWRSNPFKVKKVKLAIKPLLYNDEELTEKTLELVKNQHEY
jgi:type I restriction enzyme R subunit